MFRKNQSFSEDKPIYIPRFISDQVVKEMPKKPMTDSHWVKYKAVVRNRSNTPNSYDIRIFDESEADKKGIEVSNYAFLDAHPDLIQFAGWFDAKTKKVEVKYTAPLSPKS